MTLHEQLLGASRPRSEALVGPYVRRGTAWLRKMTIVLLGVLVVLGVIMGVAHASGGHAPWPKSLLIGIGGALGFGGLFFIAPVVVFWLLSRRRMRHLLSKGELVAAAVTRRYEQSFKGNPLQCADIEYSGPGGQRHMASFQGDPAAALSVGDSVHVVADDNSSVAIVWPPDGLALARRR